MTYFISDLHLGHERIIKLCNRPFGSVTEMDEALIEGWNKKVKKNDTVYVLGDVVWDKNKVVEYMRRLSGKKILVAGNHDKPWVRREECLGCFDSAVQYLEISLEGHPITMCHYPMLEWRSSREDEPRKLGYHIHGHIHNRISEEYRALYMQFNALNAGVDVNGYTPATFGELVENNMRFKLAALSSDEDREKLLAMAKACASTT